MGECLKNELVGGFNPLKNISQIGNLPQMGVENKQFLKPQPSEAIFFW